MKLKVGESSLEEHWKEVLTSAGIDDIKNWKDYNKRKLDTDLQPASVAKHSLLPLLRRLQSRGYKIGVISNHYTPWFDRIMDAYNYWEILKKGDESVLVSDAARCAK